MTLEELQTKVRKWDLQSTGAKAISKYTCILTQLQHHAIGEWREYLPAHHPDYKLGYMDRLAAWVGNVSKESDQKLLLEYALYINFFSHEDFVGLYRTALNREVTKWIASQINCRLENSTGLKFHELIDKEIHKHTWFCPITDSMDINEFCKVNHLTGVGEHPGISGQQMLAEHPTYPNVQIANDWIRYMSNPSRNQLRQAFPLRRIVLLEDVVGSSTQCIEAVRWVVGKLGKPVLFIPLILCPNGLEALRREEIHWNGRLAIRPIVELSRGDLLGPERQGHQGWLISKEMEKLTLQCSPKAFPNVDAFGYRGTGCSLTTFSNTPDNTLPLVHNKPANGGWAPLFPRVHRD